jgi:hypothetical protein
MRIFGADGLCVTVEDIDFHNPERLEDGRERGVRVELRTIAEDSEPGSIYASRALDVGRAVCRFDLLESAPGAQDRMHWHPTMTNGEPCTRVFDADLRDDPLAFLGDRLRDGVGLLERCEVERPQRFASDADSLARIAGSVVAEVSASLDRSRREPWPAVDQRDERGMPVR